MNNILKSFGLYWHAVLDIILTHVYVIAFLRADHAMLAAFFMSFDSLLRVTLAVIISRLVMCYHSSVRYRISAVLRLALIIIGLIAIFQVPLNKLTALICMPYLIFKLAILVDAALTSDLIFAAHEKYHIDLSKSAAAQNILARASTAFAPAIALILLQSFNAKLAGFFSAIIIGLSFTFALRAVLFDNKNQKALHKASTSLTFNEISRNPMMRWGLTFQILGNLAFGGVSFLLLAMLKLHTNVLFNEITALYAAFLFTQAIILIYGEGVVPLYHTTHVAYSMALCALCVLATSLMSFSALKLCLCAGIGLFYSLTLSGIQKVVVTALKGPSFISYSSWAQTASRLTAFLAISTLGFLLHKGFESATLLTVLGIMGLLSAFMLIMMSVKIVDTKNADNPI